MAFQKEAFYAGQCIENYEYFGAHPTEEGWVFRVWAPMAQRVALSGDFNEWQSQLMHNYDGVWELTVENAKEFDAYKYIVTTCNGTEVWKADPYGFHTQTRPENSSKLYDISGYEWHDARWAARCRRKAPVDRPLNIYEVHLGSWKKHDNGQPYSYRDLAESLPQYVADMGYTAVEFMPVTEYPLDESWGYQVTGYFAPTSRYGQPKDFMYLVDKLHEHNIAVILDWVPSHFCKDSHGLINFDGSCVYEYSDPLKWEHESWGTRVFDFGKGEVRSFLLSSAAFWLKEYHLDGLRVDAVASMLYLDYDRREWRPNKDGGKENLEAISFLQDLNRTAFEVKPYALMVAEESTAWPLVTYPPDQGGLGFNLKWNMGWMNDICHYLKMDPFFRRDHHHDITFSMFYAFSENFVLPLSHDEVVHMKGSLRGKMPGDDWRQLAGVRSFYTYLLAHPGKVLNIMGTELAQWHEWNWAEQIDWYLQESEAEKKSSDCIRALNHFYLDHPQLWENDRNWEGFQWLVADDNQNNVIAFIRRDLKGRELTVVVNFSPVAREDYRFGVPAKATYEELFNTDDARWGGSGVVNDPIAVEHIPSHGWEQSIAMRIPPLGAVVLQGKGRLKKNVKKGGNTK